MVHLHLLPGTLGEMPNSHCAHFPDKKTNASKSKPQGQATGDSGAGLETRLVGCGVHGVVHIELHLPRGGGCLSAHLRITPGVCCKRRSQPQPDPPKETLRGCH